MAKKVKAVEEPVLVAPLPKLDQETASTAISTTIQRFNFNNLHKAMTALGWRWNGSVPNVPRLRNAARRMLTEAAFEVETAGVKSAVRSSGGFTGSVGLEEHADGSRYWQFYLEFTLDTSTVDIEIVETTPPVPETFVTVPTNGRS